MTSAPWLFNLLPYRPAPTGLSRYVERLLSAWPAATGSALPEQLRLNAAGMAILANDAALPGEQSSRRMRWLQNNALVQHAVPVRRLVDQANPTLIYSPYTDRLLAVGDRPQVITCHDLTPLHWPSSRRAYWRSRLWLPRHLQAATHVVAISRHVADLLLKDGLPAERITVIPNGVEQIFDPMTSPSGADLMLLARHAHNKNIALALQGFARFLTMEPHWQGGLVIVGGAGSETADLLRLERQLNLQGRVRWRPYLSEVELELQWRSSWAYLSSSWMEGFDYPLLEAQARGLPTLASWIPVHEELHSNVALLVDVADQGVDLAIQLRRLVHERGLWKQLSKAGIQNALRYSLSNQCSSLYKLLEGLC